MAITSTVPTSERGYLSQGELEQYANITITDTAEADDRILQAEELIDSFIGPQDSFIKYPIEGRATAGASSTITLESVHQNVYDVNYLQWCMIEIIGGTGAGQRRKIASNTKAGVVTVEDAWTTAPDSTSFYRISQVGKFPRRKDVTSHNASGTITYYKDIPDAITRAVASQVEFVINMGDKFFATDQAGKQSESIGDYSYSQGDGSMSEISRMIAPKAKLLLRGFINRKGRIVA